jgi:hypothetical protein
MNYRVDEKLTVFSKNKIDFFAKAQQIYMSKNKVNHQAWWLFLAKAQGSSHAFEKMHDPS